MAPCALTVFVSPLAAKYTQRDTYRRPHVCGSASARTLPTWESLIAGFPQLPGRTPPRPHAQTWDARRRRRPRPVGRQAKPGAAATWWLPGGGAARRPEHAQWARLALGARRKRSFALIPAAALGYAVPASVAVAPRFARHLPLGPRRPPVAPGAPLWVSGAQRRGPRGPRSQWFGARVAKW